MYMLWLCVVSAGTPWKPETLIPLEVELWVVVKSLDMGAGK